MDAGKNLDRGADRTIFYSNRWIDLPSRKANYGIQRAVMNHQNVDSEPIDVVITWVDGNTASHRQKRDRYMADSSRPLHENAINPHRWANNDEILYCLQSIENFAPWTRCIWIVVDSETPDLSSLSCEILAKTNFVSHAEIFNGFSSVLPTFNSLAIESMIWRIEGLSERFLYFNDDVFLTSPLLPKDVFKGLSPVLRGQWVDHSELLRVPEIADDPSRFNHFMQINAALIVGFEATKIFSTAHVVHPLRRSVMADLFDQYLIYFVENIKHRFRDLSQFLPQGLHNHACIAADCAVIHALNDHFHITSGYGVGRPWAETSSFLQNATNPEIKFLCVNDLPQLEAAFPEARDWLRLAIGGTPSLAS